MKKIFSKRTAVDIIYYDGTNMQEVIDFFTNLKTPFAKYLSIEDGELHYKLRDWHTKKQTLINPNYYIRFWYDEDDWHTVYHVSKKEFDEIYFEADV